MIITEEIFCPHYCSRRFRLHCYSVRRRHDNGAACPVQTVTMKNILIDYAASVGPNINFQKSILVPINLSAHKTSALAEIFQWSVRSMPFTYLGLPMGTTRPSMTDLMPMEWSGAQALFLPINALSGEQNNLAELGDQIATKDSAIP